MRLPDGPSLKISEQKDVQTPEEIAAECGDLGVMPVPEGADASQYRKCRHHPLAGTDAQPGLDHKIEAALPMPTSSAISPHLTRKDKLVKRGCWYGADFGCTRNWCWMRCNEHSWGKWCWTAANHGNGDWLKCSNDQQCDFGIFKEIGCGDPCNCA